MIVQALPLVRVNLESCVKAWRWTVINLGSVKLRPTRCVPYLSEHRISQLEEAVYSMCQ